MQCIFLTNPCLYLFETKDEVGSLVSDVMAGFQNQDCFVLYVVYNLYKIMWI